VKDARARFYDETGHEAKNVERSTPNVQRSNRLEKLQGGRVACRSSFGKRRACPTNANDVRCLPAAAGLDMKKTSLDMTLSAQSPNVEIHWTFDVGHWTFGVVILCKPHLNP
jgi:hypothetical protein